MASKETLTPEEMQTPKATLNPGEPLTSEGAPTPEEKPTAEGKPAPEEKQSLETSAPETPTPETPTPKTLTQETPASETSAIAEAPAPAISKYLNLPDELMLKMLNRIPDYHWPEAWFIVRRVSQTWKFEAEALFQRRYLSSMHIAVGSWAFQFDHEQEGGERAFFKCKHKDIKDGEWQLITRRLALGYSKGNSYMYMIGFPNLGVLNDTAFVDLMFDSETRKFSFKWLPTVGNLFREEIKIRKMIRDRIDQFLERVRISGRRWENLESKEDMYYKDHKSGSVQEQVLMAVRERPWKKSPPEDEPISHVKARRRSPTSLMITLPIARSKLLLKLDRSPGMFSW